MAALIPTTMLHVRFTPDGGHWTTVQVGVRLQFMHLRVALRSILVEPVHDAGPPLAADAGETVAAMRNQGIDQGAGPMAGGGMNDKFAGFIDVDDVVVLIDDIERDRLGRRLGRLRGWNIDPDGHAGIDAVARIADRLTADGNGAGFDQNFEAGPRQFGDVAGKQAVEPLALLV